MSAENDIGKGPISAAGSYSSATTFGPPTTPARPTLVQNND